MWLWLLLEVGRFVDVLAALKISALLQPTFDADACTQTHTNTPPTQKENQVNVLVSVRDGVGSNSYTRR